MPRIAAFPKAWLDALCIDGSMSLRQWIDLSANLDIDGLELYNGMLDLQNPDQFGDYRQMVEDQGRSIPMFCCSPDFTQHDKVQRQSEIDKEKRSIDAAAALGASYCRVLSGQRRPDVEREQGIRYCVECIQECLPYARDRNITLIMENHYKDNYWHYPEFAQHMEVFCELVSQIDDPNFGVNFDPSNTLLAGEDPLELLRRIKHRVVTMHASDRYLTEGNIEDLFLEHNDSIGYADRLRHGEIGQGTNDYDAIFVELRSVGFDSWISIEDGVDGIDQMHRSIAFLRRKVSKHWPDCQQ